MRLVNDGKTDHAIEAATRLIEAQRDAPVPCLGLASKANIDDCRESPALRVAAALATRFGDRIRIVEPYAKTLPAPFERTGATLIDIDEALATCPVMIVLVDHDLFRSVPPEERCGKTALDTRGIWGDRPVGDRG